MKIDDMKVADLMQKIVDQSDNSLAQEHTASLNFDQRLINDIKRAILGISPWKAISH